MKQSTFLKLFVSLTFILSIGSPALAHHSFTMVDRTSSKLVIGKVVEWHFNSPHAWLYIEAPDENGDLIRWGVEGGAPVHIIRMGVKGDTFKLGEQVKVVMSPMRNGRPAGGVCFVEKADGEIVMFNDGACQAPGVLEAWKENDWLDNGKHMDSHPVGKKTSK